MVAKGTFIFRGTKPLNTSTRIKGNPSLWAPLVDLQKNGLTNVRDDAGLDGPLVDQAWLLKDSY